jgi:Right handed beta helix region/Periplasmic copper-binding protein (NosD)
MHAKLTTWSPLLILGVLGVLAGLGRFMISDREADADGPSPSVVAVTSGADRGPGSLRSALFSAMRADRHVTIDLQVPAVDLEISLPPVAVAHGVTLRGSLAEPTVIRNLDDTLAASVLLHLVSQNIKLTNITVDAAGATGVVVTGAQVVMDNIEVRNAEVGVTAVDAEQLTISNSRFSTNNDGVRIEGKSGSVRIDNNHFAGNRRNSLWIAFGTAPGQQTSTIIVHDNRFSGSRNAFTAANAVVDLRGNRVSGFARTGLTLISSRASIADNRITDSHGIGMHLSDLSNSYIVNNEVGRNQQVGMLIVDAKGVQVDSNEIYENGYGIVTVGRETITAALRNNTLSNQTIDGLISIGDTPTIDSNHALQNRQAGIRIMDLLLPDQRLVPSSPRYVNNTLTDNGDDDILFGQYVVRQP